MIEGKPLVPSLVIHTANKRNSWLCGQTAASYRPAKGDRVFTNWKADLFSSALTPQVSGSLKAAGKFFGWLHRKISDAGIDVAACRVKVCLPVFRGIEGPASILGQEMELAGWTNVGVSRVEEPRANTVGVFSEGRNALYRGRHPYGINPIYMEMYPQGSPLLNHMRQFTLAGGSRRAPIAVVDVGSFTTDLSVVDFHAGADGDCIASAQQTSYKVGIIAGFEEPLLAHLSARRGFTVESLSFEDREAIKQAFALGKTYVLTLADSRNIRLGDAKDQEAAKQIAADMALRIWESYRDTTGGRQVKYLVLTGGGSAAPLVRDAIQDRFRGTRVTWVGVEGMETPSRETGSQLRWPNTGEGLTRLATALGAASVILDLPQGAAAQPEGPVKKVESPWITCTCQGGNKECMRCGGSGMYRRTAA